MSAALTRADTIFVPIARIEVGERRRKKVGDLRALKASIEEHGLFHPILLRDETELVAGQRRLEACRALGWTKIPARDAGKLSDADLRAIELEENETHVHFTPAERTRQRLAEIEKAEKKERDSRIPTDTPVKKRGHRQGAAPGSIRSRATASGLPAATVQKLDAHAAAVKTFPVLENWPKTDAIKAAKQLSKLPEEEHEAVGAILERPEVPEVFAKRIVNALPDLPVEKREAIYKAMESNDEPRIISALNAAAAQPLTPEPALLMGLDIVPRLKKWRERLEKIGESTLARVIGEYHDGAEEATKMLKGRKVQL